MKAPWANNNCIEVKKGRDADWDLYLIENAREAPNENCNELAPISKYIITLKNNTKNFRDKRISYK